MLLPKTPFIYGYLRTDGFPAHLGPVKEVIPEDVAGARSPVNVANDWTG